MLNEENSYFKSVVKDAIESLKRNGSAFVFNMEQVDAVKEEYKGKFDVIDDDGYFKLIDGSLVKEERRGRKKNDKNKKL